MHGFNSHSLLPSLFSSFSSLSASRLDLKSPLHVWNFLLAETRRLAKEHSGQAEVYTNEMTARFEIMAKDVQVLSRRVCCIYACYYYVQVCTLYIGSVVMVMDIYAFDDSGFKDSHTLHRDAKYVCVFLLSLLYIKWPQMRQQM